MSVADPVSPFFSPKGAIFLAPFILLLYIAIYRLYFHPLAKYPGPFWARLTTWPSYIHALKGDRHVWFWTLQQQYGPKFRYAPNNVLINTPTAFRTIFAPRSNIKKSEYYETWPHTAGSNNTWDAIDSAKHSRKRRVLNSAFSEKALREAEVFVVRHADRWCELIGEEVERASSAAGRKGKGGDGGGEEGWSEGLMMSEWVNWLVFDILGDLCFGKSFGMKEPGSDMRFLPDMLSSFLKLVHPIALSPFRSLWVWLKPHGLDRLFMLAKPSSLKKWQRFVETCVEERIVLESEQQQQALDDPSFSPRKDFCYYLFRATDPATGEKGYSTTELFGECELMTSAGSDTTSTVIAATLFYLARNPRIQARLAAEVRAAFASAGDIRSSGARLKGCRYLHAVLMEALRMNPPLAAEPPREVLPGGLAVDGEFFQGGVGLSTGLYCLHYSEEVFSEPFVFEPERWMVGERGEKGDGGAATVESVARAESGFAAFLMGTRGCVGKNLAWLEMEVVVAKVVYQFEMRQVPGNNLGGGDPNGEFGRRCEGQYQTFDSFVGFRKGPVVQFKKRDSL